MARSIDSALEPARALRALRVQQGLTLRALAARVGLPFSTLSKLENGKMELTYDKLFRLAQGLGVDLGSFLTGAQKPDPPPPTGRRSVTRAGEVGATPFQQQVYAYLAADLVGKVMMPVLIEVNARSIEEMGGMARHSGEEFVYVLQGAMELHTELYTPLQLNIGDSVYFDSGMAHAYVRASIEPCTVLSVSAGAGVHRLAHANGKRGGSAVATGDEDGVAQLET